MFRQFLILWFVLIGLPVLADSSLLQPPTTSSDGQSRLSISGTAVAGSQVNASITFSLSTALNTGAEFSVCPHWQHDVNLQHEYRNEPGFIEAAASPGLQLRADYTGQKGIYGGLESERLCPSFVVTSGSLPAGNEIRLNIGQLALPIKADSRLALAVAVRPSKGEKKQVLTGNFIKIQPASPALLDVHASPFAEPGESVETWVRIEDAHGNLVADRSLSLDLVINGIYQRRVNISSAAQRIDDISFDRPGTYRLEFRTGGGGLRGASNPIVVKQGGKQLLWMEIGETTALSDGAMAADDYIRSRQGEIDLVIPSDHGQVTTESIPSDELSEIHDLWTPSDQGKGSYLGLMKRDGRQIVVARPEQPTDIRWQTPATLKLAEIVSGASVHRWLLKSLIDAGYSPGVTGSPHSHQYPGERRPVFTAVVLDPGQNWLDALTSGQTYVSVGSKIILQTSMEPLRAGVPKLLSVNVAASQPVSRISLFRNGKLLSVDEGVEIEGGAKLTLYSPNKPYGRRSTRPRNAREWIGYISLREGTFRASAGPDWQIESGRQRVDFLVRTHGQAASMNLDLTGVADDGVLEVVFAGGFEDAAWLPPDRMPQPVSAKRFLIPVSEIQNGAQRIIATAGYQDIVKVEPLYRTDALNSSHSYRDESNARAGDYYHYEIELVDGSFAITSPRIVVP